MVLVSLLCLLVSHSLILKIRLRTTARTVTCFPKRPQMALGLATNAIFFCFLFVLFFLFPLIGEALFSSVPPSNSLVSVEDPRRAF